MYNHPAHSILVLDDLLLEEAYLSSTPRPKWEVAKRLAAYQLHGSKRPRMVLMRPPSLRVAVTGREYHCPHCLSSPCRGLLGSHKICFSLRAGEESLADRKDK